MTANRATLDLSITGMTCGSCVQHVSEALRGVDGVAEAQVDLQGSRATVTYDPASATAERMIEAVEEAGYRAEVAPAARQATGLPIRSGAGCSCCR
jgi:copper chaperone CopZ